VRSLLIEKIDDAVAATARQLVEDEVRGLVGEPWSRKDASSPLRRGGSTRSRIHLGGEPLVIERTRVRDKQRGREQPLESLEALASRDALNDDVRALLVRGVSTRDYDGALTNIADGLGLQRSAVSAAFTTASQKDLDELNGRSLAELMFAAIFIDGVHFAEEVTIVVLGIDTDGRKHILGLREGATENAQVVGDLLSGLIERGLRTPERCLFVLDGAKALSKAVRKTFGQRALVQRCQIHKLRNVISYLPPSWHPEARRRLRAAWGMTSFDDADKELQRTLRWLKEISESAAASLDEGLQETITVYKLGVSGALRKTLRSTNPIDSAFDAVRKNARRVKRWRNGSMIMRWVATGLVMAEAGFRRVRGHKDISALVLALDNNEVHAASDAA